ncbi:MAG TPA: hypothetical protein VJ696_02305 [Rhodanobacteraceae bacterium]|nr:hypothetical protein [Rhodanobacteraceae bacterium]
MKALIRVTLALAAVAVACPVLADMPAKTGDAAVHAAIAVAKEARLADMTAARTAAKSADSVDEAGGTGPRTANPYRAYPPSCAADPLPFNPSGSGRWSADVPLYTRDSNGNPGNPETVTITIWRIACSSSGLSTPYNVDGLENAMLMMRIDRGSTDTDVLPTFPFVTASQGNADDNLVRFAMEPNTVISERAYDSLIPEQTSVYVFENYPFANAGLTLFNYDFTLNIDPVIDSACTGCTSITIPGYAPTPQSYPAAYQPLPIDGYMSSSWYVPGSGGEGVMLNIYDNAGGTTRTLFAAWYTYDANGIPFWLVAQGVANVGSSTFANVPVSYYTGGGFAGDFSGVDQHSWGTMSFTFPDCMTMNVAYDGSADAVSGGPAGNGTRTFTRLADINGLNCE